MCSRFVFSFFFFFGDATMDRELPFEEKGNEVNETHEVKEAKDGTRRSFLRRAATVTATGAAGIAGMGLVSPNEAQASESNPLLTAQAFQDIKRHENAHVNFLLKALGGLARPRPTFKGLPQFGYGKFFKSSQTLENT
jgi:hypothetical protein